MKKILLAIITVLTFVGCESMSATEMRANIDECTTNDLGYVARYNIITGNISDIYCCIDKTFTNKCHLEKLKS